MNSKRRNGKLASCEPCRKDKVRCDHRTPVCSRCQRRRTASRCFYHPAPLTRGVADGSLSRDTSRATTSTRSPHSPGYTTHGGDSQSIDNEPTPSSREGLYTPSTDRSTGYLGPTSFVASFEEDQGRVSSPNDRFGFDNMGTIFNMPIISTYWVEETKKALGYLKDLPMMADLVREHYRISESAPIPGPLVLNALDELVRQASNIQVEWIIRNTAQKLDVPPDIQGHEFHTLFTGPNLRLETIGLIYCLAGIANIFCLPQRESSDRHRLESRLLFARKMLMASDTLIQVCKLLTPVNDLMIWALYENMLSSTVVHGDYSSIKWHRLGELTTYMFELGLHREPQQPSSLPTFLLESRRRVFAATYQLDKGIATFLGRPPRITWRHSDCNLPLDINDEALSTNEGIELASRSVNSDGWSVHAVFQRSSFIRLRFFVSLVREEILELSMQTPSEETTRKLREVSLRCHQTWNELPAHLRYTPTCWDQDIPFAACLMLIATYLTHLHNHFLIQRLLVQQDVTAQPALLDVSSTLLSTVLAFETHNERMIDIQRDFVWIILLYGFPSAGVLIKALQKHARTGRPSLDKGLKPRLIRDLSVFISRLEAVSRLGIAEHGLFTRASKLLTNILDEVLEPATAIVPDELDFELFDTAIDGLGGLDDINFDAMEFGGVYDQWIF